MKIRTKGSSIPNMLLGMVVCVLITLIIFLFMAVKEKREEDIKLKDAFAIDYSKYEEVGSPEMIKIFRIGGSNLLEANAEYEINIWLSNPRNKVIDRRLAYGRGATIITYSYKIEPIPTESE